MKSHAAIGRIYFLSDALLDSQSIVLGVRVGSHLVTCRIGKELEVQIVSLSATNVELRKSVPYLHTTGRLGSFDRLNVS